MKKYLVLSLIFFIIFNLSEISFAQPQTEWVQRYNSFGSQEDYIIDMAIDSMANIYLTGYVIKSTFDYDIITIKYNSSGIFEWSRTFDGTAHGVDIPVGIEINDSSYIYVGGHTKDSLTNIDYLIIKYDNTGNTVWIKQMNYFSYEKASSMCLDKFGNILISGSGMACGTCIPGYLTAKFNSDGQFQWVETYKGPSLSSDFVRDITSDSLANVYVTGMVVGNNGAITIKYNQRGDTVWIRESTNGGNILEVNSNDLYLIEANHRLIKYDLDGILYWIINNEGEYYDMLSNDSGSIYMTGFNGPATITKKFNNKGDLIWSHEFRQVPNSGNFSNSIAIDNYSNIFITGYTNNNTPWNRFLTVSYNWDGSFKWSQLYNNNSPFLNHEAIKVKTDKDGNIYVAGNSHGNGTNCDIALIKYSELTGFPQLSNGNALGFKLFPNYPNPFNPITNIKYEIPVVSDIKFKVIDVLGKEVFKLLHSKLPPGVYNFDFNGTNYPSGIYILSFIADDNLIKTQKLLLVK